MTCRIVLDSVCKHYTRSKRGGKISLMNALLRPQVKTEDEVIRAVDGLSLTIREGERVGIIGPNGAGKSTLLHLIAGLSPPSSGYLEVIGTVHAVMTLGAVLRDDLSGLDNIYLDAEIQGRRRLEVEAVCADIVAFSELGDFIERPVRTYSSGMKARLAFSMMVHMQRDILIVDEALSVGDVYFSRKASERIKQLAESGRIVIFVSHGIQSIKDMCTRCIWIDQGRVLMDGDPAIVTAAYLAQVHSQDQGALRRKFGLLPQNGGLLGARLEPPQVVQDGKAASTLQPGHSIAIVLKGDASSIHEPRIDLLLHRLDGTLITTAEAPGHVPSGAFSVEVLMSPLVLGVGLYRADVRLMDGGAIRAVGSTVFEVKTTAPLIGGVPMLFYPAYLNVESTSEEMCDS